MREVGGTEEGGREGDLRPETSAVTLSSGLAREGDWRGDDCCYEHELCS